MRASRKATRPRGLHNESRPSHGRHQLAPRCATKRKPASSEATCHSSGSKLLLPLRCAPERLRASLEVMRLTSCAFSRSPVAVVLGCCLLARLGTFDGEPLPSPRRVAEGTPAYAKSDAPSLVALSIAAVSRLASMQSSRCASGAAQSDASSRAAHPSDAPIRQPSAVAIARS